MNLDSAYLAGILDGMGTITITRHRQHRRPHWVCKTMVWISTSNSTFLATLKRDLGGSVGIYNRCKKKKTHRKVYFWRIMAHEKIRLLLERVAPFMVVKKARALLMIDFIQSRQRRGRDGYSRNELRIQSAIRKLNSGRVA